MMPRHDSGNPEAGELSPNPIAGRVEPAPSAPTRPEAAVPPGLNAGPDIKSLLGGLRRRWLTAATLGGLLACVAAAGAWYLLAPKATASSVIRVAFIEDTPGAKQTINATAFTTFLKSQASMLVSRPVIKAALEQPKMKQLHLEEKYPDPYAHLQEELKVEMMESSEFLTLTYSCVDSAQAEIVVDAITKAYLEEFKGQDGRARTGRLDLITAAFNDAEKERDKFSRLYNDQVGTNGSDPEELKRKAEDLRATIKEKNAERHALAVEKAKLEGSVQAAQDRIAAAKDTKIPDADLQKALEADLEGRRLIYDLTRYERVVSEYENGGNAPLNSPTYVRAKENAERLKKQLDKRRASLEKEMSTRLVEGLQQDLLLNKKSIDSQVDSLAKGIAEMDRQLTELNTKSYKAGRAAPELEAARHEFEQATKNADLLRAQLEEVRLLLKTLPRVTIYQEAALQKRDTKKQLVGTAAAPVGMFLVVSLVLAYGDYQQRRVRSVRDMSSGLGIPVFGVVPEVAHPERHLIGPVTEPEIEAQPVLESIDALRTQLLHSSAQESCRIVLVTSAVAGEGKTTLASHLATSMARAGRKTLLVDGDLRRPGLHQLFELPQQPGLSEVLLGEVEAVDAVQATTLEGLSVVTAGQWDRDVMQALARGTLGGVFEKFLQEFDFVIVDSHPVLAATDTLVIAQQVEGVILSVRRDLSQTPRVYAAQQKLTALGVRLLGAVVSGADPLEIYGSAAAPAPAAA